MPGVLILEAMQVAALLTFSEEQPKDPENTLYYFVGIDGARFASGRAGRPTDSRT